jgi:hypothetical protein
MTRPKSRAMTVISGAIEGPFESKQNEGTQMSNELESDRAGGELHIGADCAGLL